MIDFRLLDLLVRSFISATFVLVSIFVSMAAASAHPHVWVDAAVIIHKNEQGQIAAVEPVWIFDDLYTATLLTDLDTDQSGMVEKNELLSFAQETVQNLHEWNYFLSAKNEAGQNLAFEEKISTESVLLNNRLLLRFKLTLDYPIVSSEMIELKMYDPSYFIAIELVKEKAVSFLGSDGSAQNQSNKVITDCESEVVDSSSSENNETPLSELFFSDAEIAENPDLGSIFAQVLRVSCP